MTSISLEKALLYEKYRLPYSPQAVDDLMGSIGPVAVVADVGAGTGQLARLFAPRCERVYAVEPDSSMRSVAGEVLKDWPNAAIVDACAEQTTLATSSVDLVVVGNAFHRFRPEACDEFRRILKQEGWIALFSYSFTDKSFDNALFPRLATLKRHAARIEKAWHRTPAEQLFGDGPTYTLRYPQEVSEGWDAFFGAACAGIEAPERGDPDFAQFEQINREVFEEFAVGGEIRVEYETRVVFGRGDAGGTSPVFYPHVRPLTDDS